MLKNTEGLLTSTGEFYMITDLVIITDKFKPKNEKKYIRKRKWHAAVLLSTALNAQAL